MGILYFFNSFLGLSIFFKIKYDQIDNTEKQSTLGLLTPRPSSAYLAVMPPSDASSLAFARTYELKRE